MNMHIASTYMVCWFVYAAWTMRQNFMPRKMRLKKVNEAVENLMSLVRMFPMPKVIPGVMLGCLLFIFLADTLGFAFAYLATLTANADPKWLYITAGVYFTVTVLEFPQQMQLLQCIGDEERMREVFDEAKSPARMAISACGSFARLVTAIGALVALFS